MFPDGSEIESDISESKTRENIDNKYLELHASFRQTSVWVDGGGGSTSHLCTLKRFCARAALVMIIDSQCVGIVNLYTLSVR